jgi:RNA polymerase sigma factor (sigma-70 family)
MKRPAQKPDPAGTAEDPEHVDMVLGDCLAKLAAGDESARVRILEVCQSRLHALAHKLLGSKFAKVRRWDDTDDVAQNAALRLYRALADTVPDSPRGLMGLVATQIHRELIDLARKHSGPMSYAANHGTNVMQGLDGPMHVVDHAADTGDDEEIPIERWERFHATVESLDNEHKEVFNLLWYLGLDQQAAAKALGCSLRTVTRRWQEAQQLVRESLDKAE